MSNASGRQCKRLPNTASKEECVEEHRQKMARRKAEAQLHGGKPTRKYNILGNLSKRHPKRGLHPSQSYS